MRVISGKYKGKKLVGYDSVETRPTMDRIKESLFGMIQGYIKDAKVLDVFAGTGSLGIEALSNGAESCIFIDNGNEIIKALEKNLEDIPNSNIINKDYKQALKEIDTKFDLIFIDPPYKNGILNNSLKLIDEYQLLSEKGIIVCETDIDEIIVINDNLKIVKKKVYGNKKITVYKV
jgi:16S rRNA (guanine(966)-N(2))-methyltransferase RsmD